MTIELHFASPLGTRQRWVAGILGIGVGFGGPFLLSVALVATSGDPSFLLLPLPCLGVLWLAQGLAPSGIRLEGDGVRLERRWLARRLPYTAIQGCDRTPRRIGGLGAVGFNALFGSHGWRWNPWTGRHYLAITNTDDLVYVHTTAGLLVISLANPNAFTTALHARLPSGEAPRGGALQP